MMIMVMMIILLLLKNVRRRSEIRPEVTDLAPIYYVLHFLIDSYIFKYQQVYQASFLYSCTTTYVRGVSGCEVSAYTGTGTGTVG
jgi:hypothetical protein